MDDIFLDAIDHGEYDLADDIMNPTSTGGSTMAMELQQHMRGHIIPSILAHFTIDADGVEGTALDHDALANLWADAALHGKDHDFTDPETLSLHEDAVTAALTKMTLAAIICEIATIAKTTATCTNDFGSFYVDDWTTIAFCDDAAVEDYCEHGFTHYRLVRKSQTPDGETYFEEPVYGFDPTYDAPPVHINKLLTTAAAALETNNMDDADKAAEAAMNWLNADKDFPADWAESRFLNTAANPNILRAIDDNAPNVARLRVRLCFGPIVA